MDTPYVIARTSESKNFDKFEYHDDSIIISVYLRKGVSKDGKIVARIQTTEGGEMSQQP